MHKHNIEVYLLSICCVEKLYTECVSVALVIQHAVNTHCTVLSSVAFLALHFLYYLIKGTIFFWGGGGCIEQKYCIFRPTRRTVIFSLEMLEKK